MKQLDAVMGVGPGNHSYPPSCAQRDPIKQECKDKVANPVCLNPMDQKGGWDLYYNVRYCTKDCVPEWNEWANVIEDAPADGCNIPWCSRSRSIMEKGKVKSIVKAIDFAKQECPPFKVLRRTKGFTVKSKRLYGDACEAQKDYCCCPVDCKAEWLDWSPCSVTCGYGTQGRGYTITQTAQCGGRNDCKPKTQYRRCIGTSAQVIKTGSQSITFQGGLAKPPNMREAKSIIVRLRNKQFRRLFSDYKPLTVNEVTLLDCGWPSPSKENGGDYAPWSCYQEKKDGVNIPGVGECLNAFGSGEHSIFAKWTQWCHPFGWLEKGEGQRRSFQQYFSGLTNKFDADGNLIRAGAKEVKVFYQLKLLGTEVKSCDCDAGFLTAGVPPVSPAVLLNYYGTQCKCFVHFWFRL